MKNINKIFLWAFIILSLLPLFEFFLFQWKNDNRIGIQTTSSISVINYPTSTTNGYVVYYLPDAINSFDDFIISECSYGIIDGNAVNLTGPAKPIFMAMANITKKIGSSTSKGPFLVHILSLSLIIARTIYIACLLLLAYIIILPVSVIHYFFNKRLLQ